MEQPMFNSCCRCFSLRNGSIASGILSIILSIISIILIFIVRIDFKTILMDWLPQNVVKIIYALHLVMTILISLLMIMGVMKKNHYFMMPWVLQGLMLPILLLISVIYNAVVYYIDGFVLGGTLWLVVGLLTVVIYVCMWIVVCRFFKTLENKNDRKRYSEQPNLELLGFIMVIIMLIFIHKPH